MAQFGKATSQRGKPSYIMSIVGVTLVLFLLGIIGWLVINAGKLGQYFRESVEVRAYLSGNVNPQDSTALMQFIGSRPYVREYNFVDKEAAKKQYLDEGNQDWAGVLEALEVYRVDVMYHRVGIDVDDTCAIKGRADPHLLAGWEGTGDLKALAVLGDWLEDQGEQALADTCHQGARGTD